MLSAGERWWIVFQLLLALRHSHGAGVCHGDINIDNVLLTSWSWVLLSDFASFKPTMLPEDNPGAFSFFFDTSGRRTCTVAPERFYTPDKAEGGDTASFKYGPSLQPAMDIFSLGCVIFELMTAGKPLFDLSQLLQYRAGVLDLDARLSLLPDARARDLVRHMVDLDPAKRHTAADYLGTFGGGLFPPAFSGFLHPFLRGSLNRKRREDRLLPLLVGWRLRTAAR